MNQFLFILQTTSPVFLITFLGVFLKKMKVIDEPFVKKASDVIYTVALPVLIFIKLATVDFKQSFRAQDVIFVIVGISVSFMLVWLLSVPFIKNAKDKCAFVHGTFRSNFAIVGFALIANLFGEETLGYAALLLAFVNPLYNFLAVILISITLRTSARIQWGKTLVKMITNPLIIAVLIGIPFSVFRISVPYFVDKSGAYLASMTLPLALICIGGSLHLETLRKASGLAILASAIKLIVIPAIVSIIAIHLGYRSHILGILFILFAAPSAVASFIMSRSLGANGRLAGNIIIISTFASCLTITIGIYLLEAGGYL